MPFEVVWLYMCCCENGCWIAMTKFICIMVEMWGFWEWWFSILLVYFWYMNGLLSVYKLLWIRIYIYIYTCAFWLMWMVRNVCDNGDWAGQRASTDYNNWDWAGERVSVMAI